MRGGGFDFLRGRGTLILAWISYGLAVAGGASVAATFVGGLISGFVGLFPGWVAIVVFLAGFVAMVIDLLVDGVPNRLAIWMGIVLPSLARAVPGKLSQTVTDLSGQLLGQINQWLGVWLGTTSSLGVAAAAVVASLLVARRVVAKGGR
jgi:hypothetical protein